MKKNLSKIPKKISKSYLENAALFYLQRYATSAANLKRVLQRKIQRSCHYHDVSPEPFIPLLEELLARYTASGLLNDENFALAKTSSLRRKGKSARYIEANLTAKGLSKNDIEESLNHVDIDEDSELIAAKIFIKKKKIGCYRASKEVTPDIIKKETQILARAGFSYKTAQDALGYLDTEL